MVGDGVNDAPVLAAADVSMTVKGGAELANSTADMILTADSLRLVSRARYVASRTRQLIRQNLTWAVLYNTSVMPLAGPLVTATDANGATTTLEFTIEVVPDLATDGNTAPAIGAPPPIVWDWLNDLQKRLKWEYADRHMFPILMPKGRTTVGAVNHCMHGKDLSMIETVLDWRPFDYFTVTQDVLQAVLMTITFQLQPTETGTHMIYICSLKPQLPLPMPESLQLAAIKRELKKLKVKEAYEKIAQLVIQENQAAS